MRAYLVIIIFPLFSCSQSQPDAEKEKFYLTTDSSLFLSRTDERFIETCSPPESGSFITVSYLYEGKWIKDEAQRNDNGYNALSGGGYFLDDKYVEFIGRNLGEGCDVLLRRPFPEKAQIRYAGDFQFIGQVRTQKIDPLALSYEEWTNQNSLEICDPILRPNTICHDGDELRDTYKTIKEIRANGVVVPVFKSIKGQLGILKLDYSLSQKEPPIEHVLNFDELSVY